MTYIYDLLLNYQDMLYDFYEWDKYDKYYHIKRIALFRVSKKDLENIINNKVTFHDDKLTSIFNKCEYYENRNIKTFCYAFLLTDKTKVIAVMLDSSMKVCAYSSLLLDEEEEVLEVSLRLQEEPLAYNIESQNIPTDLTRYDQTLKDYVLKDIRESYRKGDVAKLKYLYYEYFNKEGYDIEKIYKELMQSLDNFNSKHYNLYQLIKLC